MDELVATLDEWIAQTETDAAEHRDAAADADGVFWRGEDMDLADAYETRLATLREVRALAERGAAR